MYLTCKIFISVFCHKKNWYKLLQLQLGSSNIDEFSFIGSMHIFGTIHRAGSLHCWLVWTVDYMKVPFVIGNGIIIKDKTNFTHSKSKYFCVCSIRYAHVTFGHGPRLCCRIEDKISILFGWIELTCYTRLLNYKKKSDDS